MDTTEEDGIEPAADPNQTVVEPGEAMGKVRAMLLRLVPPDSVMIEDVYGNQYNVRPTLPARRQIKVMRHIEKLLNLGADTPELQDFKVDGVKEIGAVIIKLASNEAVLETLCDAFADAHPKVVEGAIAAAKDAGDKEKHVADLFAVEEIVGGLVPFCIRLATKLLDLIQAVVPNEEAIAIA